MLKKINSTKPAKPAKQASTKPALKDILRGWYFKNPAADLYSIRTKIIDATEISPAKFYNWLSGRSTPNKYERAIINEIAKQKIY